MKKNLVYFLSSVVLSTLILSVGFFLTAKFAPVILGEKIAINRLVIFYFITCYSCSLFLWLKVFFWGFKFAELEANKFLLGEKNESK